MEKRSLLLSVALVGIMLAYPHYLRWISPRPAEVPAGLPYAEALQEEPREREAAIFEEPQAEENIAVLETAQLRLQLSTVGGAIARAEVKDADLARQTVLIEREPSEPLSGAMAGIKGLPNLEKALFRAEEDNSAGGVRFSYEDAGRFRLVKTYRPHQEPYLVLLEEELTHLAPSSETYQLEWAWTFWGGGLKGHDQASVTTRYLTVDGLKEERGDKLRKGERAVELKTQWVGLERKYFAFFAAPETPYESVRARSSESMTVARPKTAVKTLAAGETWRLKTLLYLGPLSYEDLKRPGLAFEEALFAGKLGWLRFLLLAGLQFFFRLFGNYGMAIVILTIATKLLFAPLTHLSFESMRKMQALAPKVKAVQEHFKGDPQRMNKEVMELYRKHKVNPMGGCLPMLIQMPIFIALYQVLAQSVELRYAPFGWIRDLSAPDRLFTLPKAIPFLGSGINVLPILMLVSMVVQQKVTPGSTASTPEQRHMMTIMPIMFGFMFYNLPSGLVLYWLLSNVLTIIHQLLMKGKGHIGPHPAADAA